MPFGEPQKIVSYLKISPGMSVADFGAGSGAYTLILAPLVGEGKIYAIDVQKDLLSRLAALARERHYGNVEVIWGNVEKSGGSKLADKSVDLVLLANVLFQAQSRYTLVLEAKRILKVNGRIALIDWQDSFGGLGPHPDQVVTSVDAEKIFAEAGLVPNGTFPAGDHHYGIFFTFKKS